MNFDPKNLALLNAGLGMMSNATGANSGNALGMGLQQGVGSYQNSMLLEDIKRKQAAEEAHKKLIRQMETNELLRKHQRRENYDNALTGMSGLDTPEAITKAMLGSGNPDLIERGLGYQMNLATRAQNRPFIGGPQKMADGTFGVMRGDGSMQSTGVPFHSPSQITMVGNVPMEWNPTTRKLSPISTPGADSQGVIDRSTVAENIATTEGAKVKGKMEAEQKVNEPVDKRRLESFNRKTNKLMADIDGIIGDADFMTTGIVGSALKRLPGTDAYDLRANIETIMANAGFDKLQEMRDNSPTGGALGQVSERELDFLISAVQNMKQSQSTEQFIENMKKVKQHYRTFQNALNDEWTQKYGGDMPGHVPSDFGGQIKIRRIR